MFRFRQHKSRKDDSKRFYLFPGQGGRAYRRKQLYILKWSVIAGLCAAALLSAIMYLVNRMEPQ